MSNAIIEIVLNSILGLVYLASAIPKLRYPKSFVLAVLEYRVLPQSLGRLYARLVPPLELLVALLSLTGTAVRFAAVAMALLLISFIVAIVINKARGRDLDCHCFGTALRRRVGWGILLQDAALLGVAIAVTISAHAWFAPEPWSVFRLSGLVQTMSIVPLLGCVTLTAGIVILVGAITDRGRRFQSAMVSPQARTTGATRR